MSPVASPGRGPSRTAVPLRLATYFHVHLVSDSTGETLIAVGRAATVQYEGVTWSDGEVFDSSWETGQAITFSLNRVIEGWKEGLAGQKVGSRVLLSIPAEKAYGEQGKPPAIGENEPLLFVVDILDAQASATPSAN